jgi:hypothetical protein
MLCDIVPRCDADGDTDIDQRDLSIISKARGQRASGPNDQRDANGDGLITPADVKVCIPTVHTAKLRDRGAAAAQAITFSASPRPRRGVLQI